MMLPSLRYTAGMFLTEDEHQAVKQAGELAVLVGRIIGDGPNAEADAREMVAAIHVVQRMVMGNAAARAYPPLYRLLGKNVTPTLDDVPAAE